MDLYGKPNSIPGLSAGLKRLASTGASSRIDRPIAPAPAGKRKAVKNAVSSPSDKRETSKPSSSQKATTAFAPTKSSAYSSVRSRMTESCKLEPSVKTISRSASAELGV